MHAAAFQAAFQPRGCGLCQPCRLLESVGSQYREELGLVLRSYLAPLHHARRPHYSAFKQRMLHLQIPVGAAACTARIASGRGSSMHCLLRAGLSLHPAEPSPLHARLQLLERCDWRVVLLEGSEEMLAAQSELEASPVFPYICATIAQWAEDGWAPPQLSALWRSSGAAERDRLARRVLGPYNQ